MSASVLLVEDDESLGATLSENLELEGYTVRWIRDGEDATLELEKSNYDLVVLDVMLPKQSGYEILKTYRTKSDQPVFMISAKGSAQDRIQGLELLADDFLPKPFHLKEFLLRIKSLLKRASHTHQCRDLIKIGNAEVDFLKRQVRVGGDQISLSEKEWQILRYLARHSNQVVSREALINAIWGPDQHPSTRTVDNFVVKLRKWLEPDPAHPEWILSHRGVGYSLQIQEEVSL